MTASFLSVTAHFTPDSNKRQFICIALRIPSPHTGVRIAELLPRIIAESEVPCNKIEFLLTKWKQHGCSYQIKQHNEDDMLNLMVMNLIQIELHQKSEELFPDLEENESKVGN